MEVRKAYKVRIYPNKVQEQILLQTIGACRFVYNFYLNLQVNAYMQTGKNITYADLSRDLTILRNSSEYPWLKEVQATPVQQSLRKLEVAYSRFFRKQSNLPKFKSKRDVRQSFSKPRDWRIHNGRIIIQDNARVKFRGTLPPEGAALKTLTVSVTKTGKWFASIQVIETIEQPNELKGAMGVDLGLTHTAITSDGQKFDNLTFQKKHLKRLKLLQQSLNRKQKGSKRREKAKLEVAQLNEKIANLRKNHLHQVSSAITGKNHAMIAVEDLSVMNMMKNRRLSRSISDVSWGELLRQIEYKQAWKGGEFIKIDRFFPSSKTCSDCLNVADSLPLSIREWICSDCGSRHDRDINAALNILKQAETQLGVESTEGSRKARVTGLVKRGRVRHDVDN